MINESLSWEGMAALGHYGESQRTVFLTSGERGTSQRTRDLGGSPSPPRYDLDIAARADGLALENWARIPTPPNAHSDL